MPGLDSSQLSSNWKKLQERLATGNPSNPLHKAAKRKRPNGTSLDSSQLSSNSKRLQEYLALGNPSNPLHKVAKRKLANGTLQTPDSVKKAKISPPKKARSRKAMSAKAIGMNHNEQSTLAEQLDVSHDDISAAYSPPNGSLAKPTDEINGGHHPTHKLGKYVAMDCEMVGTGAPPYDDNVLARVSLVNFNGEQIYDSYVLPPPGIKVEDYRTFVSGIKPSHLAKDYARPLVEVQKDVASIMDDRILVGHALSNDLQALLLSHPKRDIRDTSRHPKFRIESRGRPPALRNLAKSELGMRIQAGEHSSIEDARAAMMLFKKEKAEFEEENRKRFGTRTAPASKGAKGAADNGLSKKLNKTAPPNLYNADAKDEDDQRLLEGEEDDDEIDEKLSEGRPAAAELVAVKKRKKKKRTKRK